MTVFNLTMKLLILYFLSRGGHPSILGGLGYHSGGRGTCGRGASGIRSPNPSGWLYTATHTVRWTAAYSGCPGCADGMSNMIQFSYYPGERASFSIETLLKMVLTTFGDQM